ncbi:MAG: response regulator [Planctomycetes bacterium]|nr:response regulator [Planctomycetota bacterium]
MSEESKRILVVDDEPDSIEFVRVVLEEEGYEVVAANSADEGLAAIETEEPELVILDVQMPGKDGFHAFSEIRRSPDFAELPVIMLTGITDKTGIKFDGELMGDYMGSEPEDFLDKPVDPVKLVASVKTALS